MQVVYVETLKDGLIVYEAYARNCLSRTSIPLFLSDKVLPADLI